MNFWADDVIKNTGFTLGAAATMVLGSGTVGLLGKALNISGKMGKIGSVMVPALISATGEGMIEAK
jgi:hypothetical protein